MIFEITFGDTVKKIREEKNLTLREVAEKLNVDTSMLGKIEKNTRKPTKAFIKTFSKHFKIGYKELLIAFMSDIVSYQLMDEEDVADEILKVAEEKVKYLKQKKKSNK